MLDLRVRIWVDVIHAGKEGSWQRKVVAAKVLKQREYGLSENLRVGQYPRM